LTKARRRHADLAPRLAYTVLAKSARMSLAQKVIVVTGASSGLGRAAAFELARRGARLVLAARRAEALESTAERCRSLGTEAIAVPTDVTRESDVARLVDTAVETWGRLDAWVNNAGVTAFGSLEASPLADLQRVLETNLWGAVYGARAVIPLFRRQGHGVIVNVGSILSKVGQPFVPAYVISKFALNGLTEALRAELADQPNIHVCTLLPYAIDTPHFQVGANLIGREPHAMPPVQSPEEVARALADLVERPRRLRHVPRIAALGLALHALFPEPVEHVIHDLLARFHFGAPSRVDPQGNLWLAPKEAAATHGERKPLVGVSGLVGWMLGHYAARGVRALVKL
jgi:NAD(P)-dependent dehydrogenase (short-subunit alcohol dehydrogenase family)